jgi:hypothetical protein
MYQAGPHGDTRSQEQIEKRRGEYLGEWAQQFTKLNQDAAEDVTRRLEIGQQIRALHSQLSRLEGVALPDPSLQERVRQCLEQSDLRALELGSPR